MAGQSAAFYSYVHSDDEADSGQITKLAEQLRRQFKVYTAEDLELFIDHDIRWGEAWRTRIRGAVAGTTFFIPVITPGYFASAECRKELFQFAELAERTGVPRLLMPIYWVDVEELETGGEDSPDAAIQLIALAHWEDLRAARYEDADASGFRKPVAELAQQLALRVREVSTVRDLPVAAEVASASPNGSNDLGEVDDPFNQDAPGLIELMATVEVEFPVVNEKLVAMAEVLNDISDVTAVATEAMNAADSFPNPMRQRLTATQRFAASLTGPAEQMQALGAEYASALRKIDPGILGVLENIDSGGADELDAETVSGLRAIVEMAETATEAVEQVSEFSGALKHSAKLSRSLRAPLAKIETGVRQVIDGNVLLDGWHVRANAILEAHGLLAAQDPGAEALE